MARTTRVRRAPNREPTSLAAGVTALGVDEAIDTIEPPTNDVDINLDLTNNDIDLPPSPPLPPPALHDY